MLRSGLFSLLLGFIAVFWGCGPTATPPEERAQIEHLRPLAVLYGRYLSQNQGRPPADEQSFRSFIQTLSPDELKTLDASNIDALFISPRDKKPYVLLFGNSSSTPPTTPSGAQLIAYERDGANGKRYIATTLGEVREIEQTEFDKLLPAK